MNQNPRFEVIISTCDKFSDLWDAHIHLLNQNWPDHEKTYLVTDAPTQRAFEGIQLVCAGEGTEITQRLKTALQQVTSEYILFTLDDYFLTEPMQTETLWKTLQVMESENLDYVKLMAHSKWRLRKEGAVELKNHKGYYLRDLSRGNYKISLYPGLWRTDFMRQTLDVTRNAWEYEVALTPMARKLNARCAISTYNEFPFLDVIRKGKVLRKANRYFQKTSLCKLDREVMSAWEEWKLEARTWTGRLLPEPVFRLLKKWMIKCGMRFYSPVD